MLTVQHEWRVGVAVLVCAVPNGSRSVLRNSDKSIINNTNNNTSSNSKKTAKNSSITIRNGVAKQKIVGSQRE